MGALLQTSWLSKGLAGHDRARGVVPARQGVACDTDGTPAGPHDRACGVASFSRWAWHLVAVVALGGFVGPGVRAQSVDVPPPMYYVVDPDAVLYVDPDRTRPYLRLGLQEPVFLLNEHDEWFRVRTRDGAVGFVSADEVSNVWIRISKRQRTLFLYRGTELFARTAADLAINPVSDKVLRGSTLASDHWRTPEGVFFIASKNPHSRFYKALVLNYPTVEDAGRGVRDGLITQEEYRAIVRAEESIRMPPMNTALGGYIEIHGSGTGAGVNWTQGCIAVRDDEIDRLWQWTHVGTPVLIE